VDSQVKNLHATAQVSLLPSLEFWQRRSIKMTFSVKMHHF
jgi:hypothetical protein